MYLRFRATEVNTNACLFRSHTGREDVSGPRLAAGKHSASLLPTSSFPVCIHFLSCPSLQSGMCRLPESESQSQETSPELNAFVWLRGICLFTKQCRKTVLWRKEYSNICISYWTLLIKFLAVVDYLTESRWGKWLVNIVMYRKWPERAFLSCFL